jgi:hypothetical protein
MRKKHFLLSTESPHPGGDRQVSHHLEGCRQRRTPGEQGGLPQVSVESVWTSWVSQFEGGRSVSQGRPSPGCTPIKTPSQVTQSGGEGTEIQLSPFPRLCTHKLHLLDRDGATFSNSHKGTTAVGRNVPSPGMTSGHMHTPAVDKPWDNVPTPTQLSIFLGSPLHPGQGGQAGKVAKHASLGSN